MQNTLTLKRLPGQVGLGEKLPAQATGSAIQKPGTQTREAAAAIAKTAKHAPALKEASRV